MDGQLDSMFCAGARSEGFPGEVYGRVTIGHALWTAVGDPTSGVLDPTGPSRIAWLKGENCLLFSG